MSAAIDTAKSVPIEQELGRRGHHLRRAGRDLFGPCPACGGTDRFAVTPTKGLWHCRHCQKGGDVIALVQHLDGGGFLDAVETLAGERPRRQQSGQEAIVRMIERERQRREQEEQERRESAAKTEYALRIWNEGVCVWGTIAQKYLASRHCDGLFPPDRDAVFRFHQRCRFGDEYLPCLLTLLRNVGTDEPQAVHRTALTPDGQKIDRKMLGPKAGAAVKLWPQRCVTDRLVVGEGIETTLSAALHVRHRDHALAPAWAAIDAGNLAALPVIHCVQQLIILSDNDEPDKKGLQAGQDAAKECSSRWTGAGREVRRLTPNKKGADFNDIVRKH
jgi:phage/plasmid primase-like uncharacterized protein